MVCFIQRSTLMRGMVGPLPDLSVLQVAEACSGLEPLDLPLAASMGMTAEMTLVESQFGLVQRGSVLSYQSPKLPTRYIEIHPNAPPSPRLPLEAHNMSASECQWVCTEEEHLHVLSLQLSMEMAHKIEEGTRDQSSVQDWHIVRKPRITSSRFREVCHVRGETSAKALAERIIRGTKQTAQMKRGAQMEFEAANEYSKCTNVNYSPCGLVVHPQTPWLGTSPDGLVFDPSATPQFGLVEIKCRNVKSFVECKYLKMVDGTFQLKTSHAYFWQVQGHLLTTGLKWCDFFVWAEEDYFVERVRVNKVVQQTIRQKGDSFYFNVYMPRYLEMKKKNFA